MDARAAGAPIKGPLFAATLGAALFQVSANLPVILAANEITRHKRIPFVLAFDLARSRPDLYLVLLLLALIGALGLAWLMTRRESNARLRLGLVPNALSMSEWLLSIVAYAGLAVMLIGLHMWIMATGVFPISHPLIDVPRFGSPAFNFLLLLGGYAPAIREGVLLRGYVQRGLSERWGPWGAIWATTCFVALWQGWPRAVLTVPAWLFLGWIAWRAGSTWSTVQIHTGVNTGVSWPSALAVPHLCQDERTLTVNHSHERGHACSRNPPLAHIIR